MSPWFWSQRQDMGPQPRTGHAMVYDGARKRTVLFGGEGLSGGDQPLLFDDTWDWDGELWRQVQDTGPDPRSGHQLAFDAERKQVVLFGGRAAGSALRDDTWVYEGDGWTQVADTGPAARFGHGLAYDSGRKRVVLFGGEVADGSVRGDTWEWDGESWTQVEDVGPAPRRGHAIAYDLARTRVVVFGGVDGEDDQGDTWEWDGTHWTQVADTGPAPCRDAGLASGAEGVVLFGGTEAVPATPGLSAALGLTWEWREQHWTQRQDIGPAPRSGHTLASDIDRGRVVLFGGLADDSTGSGTPGVLTGDTWELPLTGSGPAGGGLKLVAFVVDPTSVEQGQDVSARVDISEPAPPGSGIELVTPTGSTTLPFAPGQVTLTFPISTQNFPIGSADLTVRLGTQDLTATITVTPPAPALNLISFTFTPNPAAPGATVALVVVLDQVTNLDAQVELFDGEGNAVGGVLVPGGSDTGQAEFSIAVEGDYEFEARIGSSSLKATLHIAPE